MPKFRFCSASRALMILSASWSDSEAAAEGACAITSPPTKVQAQIWNSTVFNAGTHVMRCNITRKDVQ